MSRRWMARRSWVLVLAALVAVAGCGRRPDVRLLVDERLHVPLGEIVSLYEMRTGQEVRPTFASPGRIDVLLRTGAHDLVVTDRTRLTANPVTTEFDSSSYAPLGRSPDGLEFACVLRKVQDQRSSARGLWLFLQEDEAAAVLRDVGFSRGRLPRSGAPDGEAATP